MLECIDMNRVFKILIGCVVVLFAGIGLATTTVYFGMQQGLLNVRGSISERNASFGSVSRITTSSSTPAEAIPPTNGCIDPSKELSECDWFETTQWEVVKGGLIKDADIINRVATETGVSPRMIAASVIPEQIRFFTDNREVFKRYFEPLKLLASLSQFSLGVSGIKQETAIKIEEYAASTTSPFYPGESIAKLLVYPADEQGKDNALFNRLTDEKNHYYSYLYTAVYLKEITAQWEKAGFDVSARPDVLVTLFNLGFNASAPKSNPQVGGATITVGSQKYSFGYLGSLFYESNELTELFLK